MEKLNGLRCRECGRHYPAAPIHVCEFCFGPLEVDYRYDALRGRVTRASIEAGPPSMWRYKDLLPIDGDVAVGHHVGFTPLIRAKNLATSSAAAEVWVQERLGVPPVLVLQGPGRLGRRDEGPRVRLRHRRVRLHRQPGELRGRPRRRGPAQSYIFIPADLEQGNILATLVYNRRWWRVGTAPTTR